jgi:carbamoyltransferase
MSRVREPWVLGISASHNGGVCLLRGNRIVVAIQEERLARNKRQRLFGAQSNLATEYCLEYAGITPSDLSIVVLCVQGKTRSPEQDLLRNPQLQVSLHNIRTMTISHHLGHAMSAFALSGFRESAILVIDGLGSPYEDLCPDEQETAMPPLENGWESISLYHASGATVTPLEKHLVDDGRWLSRRRVGMPSFGSLGGMYSAVAMQLFGDPLEAGQVMGLAPYGKQAFKPSEFFDVVAGRFIFHDRIPKMFSHNKRWPNCRRQYQNLACSVQQALETAVLYLARHLRRLTKSENLCYAGGVALNCVTNELLIGKSGFKRIHIAPAAEDSGAAVGAAYYGLLQLTKRHSPQYLYNDALGREYSKTIRNAAVERTPGVTVVRSSRDVLDETVERLCAGQIAGWFNGRSELGPRALGQRSILADPRNPEAKTLLNTRIKFRAAFRPFAPSILQQEAKHWFEINGNSCESPFMLRVLSFKSEMREKVPAVVHVDGTGRVHTVHEKSNAPFYDLLRRFHKKTKVPILLNTSFNGPGEPIVETPEDALWCLLFTGLDFCVLQDRIIVKDGSLNSVLDLYPKTIASSYSQEPTSSSDRFMETLYGDDNVLLRVNTAWGETLQAIPSSIAGILVLIDGRSSGWTLLQRLSEGLGKRFDQSLLKEILATLRRKRVITLRAEPL